MTPSNPRQARSAQVATVVIAAQSATTRRLRAARPRRGHARSRVAEAVTRGYTAHERAFLTPGDGQLTPARAPWHATTPNAATASDMLFAARLARRGRHRLALAAVLLAGAIAIAASAFAFTRSPLAPHSASSAPRPQRTAAQSAAAHTRRNPHAMQPEKRRTDGGVRAGSAIITTRYAHARAVQRDRVARDGSVSASARGIPPARPQRCTQPRICCRRRDPRTQAGTTLRAARGVGGCAVWRSATVAAARTCALPLVVGALACSEPRPLLNPFTLELHAITSDGRAVEGARFWADGDELGVTGSAGHAARRAARPRRASASRSRPHARAHTAR